MLNFKLYIDDIFRTTIKAESQNDIFALARRNYGDNVTIRVVRI